MAQANANELSKFVWGEERLERRLRLLNVLSQNSVFSDKIPVHALSRRDVWTLRAQQSKELIELRFQLGWSRQDFLDALRLVADSIPVYAQYWIFIKNLEAQMSPEQQAYWIPKAERFEIFGCYAQTELGHGSNLHGLETTATFDKATDEFILHSPTLSSTKFWIGTLGCWATHAIVVARLIIDSEDLGNHLFLTQVRDLQTHDTMPGVTIYDHGEKAMGALTGVDNGAMRFSHYRIPRSQMFAGAASVERDGMYKPAKIAKHALTSMVIIRGVMSDGLGIELAKGTIIAIRYTRFRRQFGSSRNGGQELPVIDYASVKYRLYPALARAVTLMLTGRQIASLVAKKAGLLENLPELHLQTVGCKVYASEHAARGLDIVRLACGGHGMLASAGLGTLYASASPTRTYEGDSYVISLQIGKAIVKIWNSEAEDTIPAMSYLNRLRRLDFADCKLQIGGPESWLLPDVQHEVLQHRAAILAGRHLKNSHQARDTSFAVLELTMAHSELVYWRNLRAQLEEVPSDSKKAMEALAQVFSLSALVDGLSAFAGSRFLSEPDVAGLLTVHQQTMDNFSQHVDAILNAFSFTDYELRSTLAKSDVSPYEAIMEEARKSSLNDSHYIRPTIISARSVWKKYDQPRL